jgi:hypothetical protein
MECVILYRTKDGGIGIVHDGPDPGKIAVFPDFDAAIAHTETLPWLDFQIVELDEL